MKIVLAVLGAVLLLAVVALLPLPMRPYLDFQVLYHADLGLLRGIPLYDHAGQVNMIAHLAHVQPQQVFVLPFPYPPWYALSTLWLALVPIDVAARLWFGVSLILLALSVWLLQAKRTGRIRLTLSLLAILWAPVLGSLFVGQYGFPVLLGAALMAYALRQEKAALMAIAGILLTFKPHLGGLILVLALVHLLTRRGPSARSGLIALATAGVVLLAVSFVASPAWPLAYWQSLTGFKDVSQCNQCVSPAMLAASFAGRGLDLAVWIAAVLAVGIGYWLVRNWSRLSTSADYLVSAGVLATLIVSPYLQNYDYLLLLVPFFELSRTAKGWGWAWLALAFLAPLAALALLGTAGNGWLMLSTAILLIQFTRGISAGRVPSVQNGAPSSRPPLSPP
jgi:hypothetical protein